MTTELLYLNNPYSTQCESKATFVEFTDLVVDRSMFVPSIDGQPNDKGEVVINGKKYPIIDTWWDGKWVHLMSHDTYPQDIVGQTVYQNIDWEIRHIHMRFRTALFILAGIAFRDYGAGTRINETYDDNAWIDVIADEITEEMVKTLESKANAFVAQKLDVTNRVLSKKEFEENPSLMAFSKGKVPDKENTRVCEIGDLPLQPDMGTQVKNTGEVGNIVIKTSLVKGKINKRLTITLS
ncbi:MAG: alanyl-tRNA editing protein [Thermoplasmataceae archaeon]